MDSTVYRGKKHYCSDVKILYNAVQKACFTFYYNAIHFGGGSQVKL